MKLRPNNALLLVEIDDQEQITPGGIHIGHGQIERGYKDSRTGASTIWGTIIAVGPGKRIPKGPRAGQREPLPVFPGDRVCVNTSAGFLELPGPKERVLVDWYEQVHLAEVGDRSVGESEAV